MDMKLGLIVLPVTDVDRVKAFYIDTAGFDLLVDHRPNENFRVVQATPPGSGCAIAFGQGVSEMAPGSVGGLHLVVADIEAAIAELAGRGLDVDGPFHFTATGPTPGVDPGRNDYGTFASFADPDGNGWLLQEISGRGPGMRLEVVIVPVADVDRAKAFYSEQCGFECSNDHHASDEFRRSGRPARLDMLDYLRQGHPAGRARNNPWTSPRGHRHRRRLRRVGGSRRRRQ